jgi:glycosyltransferase involved in cell wall biosynthesis
MNRTEPLISIGMPAFNCKRTLALAIRSILKQSYQNWELLVVEDGSSDETVEVARSFSDSRIRVMSDGRHKGLVARLNQAVAASRGRYFARMDADDVAYPERLEHQVEFLERHPEVHLLGCGMLVFRDNGAAQGCRVSPRSHEELCREPTDGFAIGHPTWMGRTRWFEAHPYDSAAVLSEDQVLLLRAFENSQFACLPEILCGYRENRLVLRKILIGRCGFAKAAIRKLVGRREYFTAAGTVLKQFAKAIVDVIAVSTGLDYRVLAHRARPLRADDLRRWTEVWSELQHETEGSPVQEKLSREPAFNL